MSRNQFVTLFMFAMIVIAAATTVKSIIETRKNRSESMRAYGKPFIIIKKTLNGEDDAYMGAGFCFYEYEDASGKIHLSTDSCQCYSLGDTIK